MYLIPLFLLSAIFLGNGYVSAYDERLVNTGINISQAAYCLDSDSAWDCVTCNKENQLESIMEKKGEQVVIGYNSNYNSLFVGFRGSSNIQNWIDNLKFSQITPYNNTQIMVEKGFHQLYTSLKEDIQVITKQLSTKYATNSILVTGHSLGGALATMMVFDLLYVEQSHFRPTLITFGSPRVGNTAFVSMMSQFDMYSNRVTHYYDMVPHVPQEFLKYSHIPHEIWYNEENNQYTICDDGLKEDPQCSDSCAPLHCTSISDHLRYLDLNMGSDGDCW